MSDLPTWAIERRARKELPLPLANTLAECLFWFQKAKHTIDGEPAFWKTGEDLRDALGIQPRTGNTHLKKLERFGYWKIIRRSRPRYGCPSPVNWLIPTNKALDLLSRAREDMVQAGVSRTIRNQSKQPSKEPGSDAQTSVEQTILSASSLPSPAQDFISSAGVKSKAKSGPGKGRKAQGEATVETKFFVEIMQRKLAASNKHPWDETSQFTWQHSGTFIGMALEMGHSADQIDKLVDDLLHFWPNIIWALPKLYWSHSDNLPRPTPRLLGEMSVLIFHLLAAAVADKEAAVTKANKKLSGNGGSFKF